MAITQHRNRRMDEELCFPNEAWSGRSAGEAVSPISPHVTTDSAEIQKIAKGPSHNGRETLCQQAELPISHPNSRQSTNPSQCLLLSANLCKVETTQLRSRSRSHSHTLAGICSGTVNEVVHCDEWIGEGFPQCDSLTCSHQMFGPLNQKLVLVL